MCPEMPRPSPALAAEQLPRAKGIPGPSSPALPRRAAMAASVSQAWGVNKEQLPQRQPWIPQLRPNN